MPALLYLITVPYLLRAFIVATCDQRRPAEFGVVSYSVLSTIAKALCERTKRSINPGLDYSAMDPRGAAVLVEEVRTRA